MKSRHDLEAISLRVSRSAIVGGAEITLVAITMANPAHAYVGPGAGLTAIGTMVAVIAALILAVVGFVWYPLKRILRKKGAPATKESPK